MEIIIKGEEKEITAFVLAIQERRRGSLQVDVPEDNTILKDGSSIIINSGQEVLTHFAYGNTAPTNGIWPNDGTALGRLGKLPEVLHLCQAEKKKIRIVFDYDPDFPKALLQIWGLEPATLPLDMSSHEEMPTK